MIGHLEHDLLDPFTADEYYRGDDFLEALLPHLETRHFYIVGGTAIRYHVMIAGLQYPPRPFNGFDIAVEGLSTVKDSICDDFLIAHLHGVDPEADAAALKARQDLDEDDLEDLIPPPASNFHMALVDRATQMKANLYAMDSRTADPGPLLVPQKGLYVPVINLEQQLVATVSELQAIVDGRTIDPDQLDDARLMVGIADLELADWLWQEPASTPLPQRPLDEALKLIEAFAADHQELLQPKPSLRRGRKNLPEECSDCVEVPGYRITPLPFVYDALGLAA